MCRSDHDVNDHLREKIALFCDVPVDHVVNCIDAPSIYDVPLALHEQDFDAKVLEKLGLEQPKINLTNLKNFLRDKKNCDGDVDIAIVGKYTDLHDAYLSVIEALTHSGVFHGKTVHSCLINGEELTEQNVSETLKKFDGILVPGGFGSRAFEGKILAAKYARENNVPFLGICLGLQAAVVEFARNVAGIKDATSIEFDENAENPVIDLMPEQEDVEEKGGTMRLGAYPCKVVAGTKAAEAYGEELIYERHRHRYEVNNAYRDQLIEAGLTISGLSPDDRLVEMVELENHPWYVASQGHPEFKSRPWKTHPLFRNFVGAAINRKFH